MLYFVLDLLADILPWFEKRWGIGFFPAWLGWEHVKEDFFVL